MSRLFISRASERPPPGSRIAEAPCRHPVAMVPAAVPAHVGDLHDRGAVFAHCVGRPEIGNDRVVADIDGAKE